jgi:NAD(P)-dependent dehydrogenase (short-subunit alcohol dehydrogenase family)
MSTGIDEVGAGDLLRGQRVLVTGGSGGIGRGICEVAARHGARLAFTWNRGREGADETRSRVEAAGAECLALQVDLGEPGATERAVAAVEEAWDGVDVLVNNAGVSESVPFVLLDDDDLRQVMEVNFFTAFRLCRAAVRGMIRRKYGRIVNISSIASSRAIPGPVHYAASKGALDGMTRSLAQEVGPYGVLVNAIAAGIFEAGLRSTIPEHHQQRYLSGCALSRFGQPAECGELTAWLASPRNTYMNGAVLVLDGGTLT